MRRIFLITVLLIIYGSLYPFHFHAPRAAVGPVSVLLHSWPRRLSHADMRDAAINILVYLPIGLFGSLWRGKNKLTLTAAAQAIGLAVALSTAMELLQYFDTGRFVSLVDIVSNFTGAVIGVLLATIYGQSVRRTMAKPRVQGAFHPSGALFLLFCWMSYQLFPLIPQLSFYTVLAKLAALGNPLRAASLPTAFAVVDWLSAALLLEAARGDNRQEPFLFLLTLVPSRMLIVSRSFVWPELAGAAVAWLLWCTWLRRYRGRVPLLAWLSAATLLLRGLAPYYFRRPATPFCWIPFAGFLDDDWTAAGRVLLDKLFLYGTAVWLFRKAGYSYLAAAAGLAALLASVEAIQIYLPGRTPEISDPIMAILVAVILRTLDAGDRQAVAAESSQLTAVKRSC